MVQDGVRRLLLVSKENVWHYLPMTWGAESVDTPKVSRTEPKVDEIGPWSEIKLEIIQKYAAAYSRVVSSQSAIRSYAYIDAFAGLGYHRTKKTKLTVKGSPRLALEVEPPFSQYHFIDLDSARVVSLRELERLRPGRVKTWNGDCNQILLNDVFPSIQYKNYSRALCLLDPYGLHLSWSVLKAAGDSKAIEIFLNFPVMDINMNVLKRERSKVSGEQEGRMTAFWGDDGWRQVAYRAEPGLFGDMEEKEDNERLVSAFCKRLKSHAGFEYVSAPLAMRNSTNATLYYLLFASPKAVASNIVNDIFAKYR